MAVIRAVFKLEDKASTTMSTIAAKAESLDRKLLQLDDRLQSVSGKTNDWVTSWENSMTKVKKATNDDIGEVDVKLKALGERAALMSKHKYKIEVDADTTLAHAKLNRLAQSARRKVTGSGALSATGDGDIDAIESNQLQRLQRAISGVDRAYASLSRTLDKVGFSLGPISARLSTLPVVLASIGPVVIGAISAGLVTLAAAITAVGVAAVAAGGLLLAFGAGVASVAIPIVYAKKRIEEKQKEVEKYKKALDRANKAVARTSQFTKDGTKVSSAYTKAVQRQKDAQNEYNKALNQLRGPEREAIKNVEALRKEWERLVVQGPSGARAMSIVNTALLFARQQLPFVAQQFNRFSLVADRLFKRMLRNAPMFRKNLEQMTASWPARFEEMGMSIGHLTNGLTGILTAAGPTMEWMSKWILDSTKRFDEWANSIGGRNQISKFFKDMQPVIKELVGLIWDIGAAIIDMATGSGRDDALYFLQEMRDIVQKTPDYVERMSKQFRKMWPEIKAFGKSVLKFFEDMAPLVAKVLEGLEGITNLFNRMPRWAVQTLVVFLIGMRSTMIRSAVWWSIAKAWRAMAVAAAAIKATGLLGGLGRSRAPGGLPMGGPAGGAGTSSATTLARSIIPIVPIVLAAGVVAAAAFGLYKYIKRNGVDKDFREEEKPMRRAGYKPGEKPMFDKEGNLLPKIGLQTTGAAQVKPTNRRAILEAQASAFDISAAGSDALEKRFRSLQAKLSERMGQQAVQGVFESIANNMSIENFQKFTRSKSGVQFLQQIDQVTSKALTKGKQNIEVNGDKWVVSYDKRLKKMSAIRIDASMTLKKLNDDYRSGLATTEQVVQGSVDAIRQSINGLAETFGVTGLAGGRPSQFYGAPYRPGFGTNQPLPTNPLAGPIGPPAGSRTGDGMGMPSAAPTDTLGLFSGARSQVAAILSAMPTSGIGGVARRALDKVSSSAIDRMQTLANQVGPSAAGMLPGIGGAASALARAFGLTITSGMRRGAVTEFGNTSLHSLGRAVDLGGSAENMQRAFNFLVGKPGIQELIYNGKAAYNGGPVVPFTGTDKHTDHVHVGFGDGVGQPSARRSGVAITFTGDVHISDGSSYQEFANRLASEIERAMKSSSGETTKEMIQ